MPRCLTGRDRMLLEVEDSIIKLQALCRGYIARSTLSTQRAKLRIAERYIVKAQARGRGFIVRQQLVAERQKQYVLEPWTVALQAAVRGMLVRRAWRARRERDSGLQARQWHLERRARIPGQRERLFARSSNWHRLAQ